MGCTYLAPSHRTLITLSKGRQKEENMRALMFSKAMSIEVSALPDQRYSLTTEFIWVWVFFEPRQTEEQILADGRPSRGLPPRNPNTGQGNLGCPKMEPAEGTQILFPDQSRPSRLRFPIPKHRSRYASGFAHSFLCGRWRIRSRHEASPGKRLFASRRQNLQQLLSHIITAQTPRDAISRGL